MKRTETRVHFMHRHVLDTVVILEEEKTPHPRFPLFNMLVPWRTLNGTYPATAQCARGADRKRQRLAEEELRESTERYFEACGAPLGNVTAFKYMGRVMTAGDDEWPTVIGNLWKARDIWGRLLHILSRKGGVRRCQYIFPRR